jgi:hypothetical protein
LKSSYLSPKKISQIIGKSFSFPWDIPLPRMGCVGVFELYPGRRLIMNMERTNVGADFWLAWILTSMIGFGVGALLGMHVAYGLFDRDGFAAPLGITLGIVMGATGGYMQWVVLREKVERVGWWVLASILGFAVAGSALGTIDVNENYVMAGILFAAIFGVAAGIMQWLVLRQKVVRSGLWILASIFGSLVGSIGVPVAGLISDRTDNYDLSTMVFGALLGAGLGIITGAALVWLLRQSSSHPVDDMITAH